MSRNKNRKKSPLGVASLENIGFFEGRVVTVKPKENKRQVPQVYTTIEQRIVRPDRGRVVYCINHFVAWNAVAKTYLEKVRPGVHCRVRFRASSWTPRGKRGMAITSLEITAFRIYRGVEDDPDAWLEDDGFLDAPPEWAWDYDPAEDGVEVA